MRNMMFYKMITGLALLLSFSMTNAQECRSDMPESTPTSRFTNQVDGVVLDTLTKLVWKRCSEGQTWDADHSTCTGSVMKFSWQDALDHAEMLNADGGYGGQSDWRVPNIKELESIVSLHCKDPPINLQVFPNPPERSAYWSSTPSASRGQDAWAVSWYYHPLSKKRRENVVRLVRGG